MRLLRVALRVVVSLWRRGEHAVYSRWARAVSAVDPHSIVRNNLVEKPELSEAFEAFNDQDYSRAFQLFKEFAEQGDVAAQNNVGVLCETGTGIYRGDGPATIWFRKAADQGLPNAQWNLASILAADLMAGQVSYDPEDEGERLIEAYMWVTLAAAQKYPGASDGARRLRKHMTADQIAEAQRLAREWKPKKSRLHLQLNPNLVRQ